MIVINILDLEFKRIRNYKSSREKISQISIMILTFRIFLIRLRIFKVIQFLRRDIHPRLYIPAPFIRQFDAGVSTLVTATMRSIRDSIHGSKMYFSIPIPEYLNINSSQDILLYFHPVRYYSIRSENWFSL